MSERKFELRAVGVDYICDACKTGMMEQTGTFLASNPPQWAHKCNSCGSTASLPEKYPTVRFERVQSW